MKAQDDERETCQQLFEHGDQVCLADPFAGGHRFILCHAVHGIDVVEAFNAVLITLMHAVHAQVTGTVLRRWSTPRADRKAHGPGLGPHPAVTQIAATLTQIVQMGHRDHRQTLVAGFVKDRKGAFHELLGGWPR